VFSKNIQEHPMAKNLEELKRELYDSFNDAKTYADHYGNNSEARALSRQAMAETARAIAAIELAVDELDARKNGRSLPGKL
jgi:hypothetical protein